MQADLSQQLQTIRKILPFIKTLFSFGLFELKTDD